MVEKKLYSKEQELSEFKSSYEDRVKQLEKFNSAEREKSILAERQTRDVKEWLRKVQFQTDNLKKELN